jgi:hypothetical protein
MELPPIESMNESQRLLPHVDSEVFDYPSRPSVTSKILSRHVIIAAIIGGLYIYHMVWLVILPHFNESLFGKIHLGIFSFLVFWFILVYFVAVFASPGDVPPNYRIPYQGIPGTEILNNYCPTCKLHKPQR